jgi:hypothetical protein
VYTEFLNASLYSNTKCFPYAYVGNSVLEHFHVLGLNVRMIDASLAGLSYYLTGNVFLA